MFFVLRMLLGILQLLTGLIFVVFAVACGQLMWRGGPFEVVASTATVALLAGLTAILLVPRLKRRCPRRRKTGAPA
jgi:cell division protein FtsW (lipid II flippase)